MLCETRVIISPDRQAAGIRALNFFVKQSELRPWQSLRMKVKISLSNPLQTPVRLWRTGGERRIRYESWEREGICQNTSSAFPVVKTRGRLVMILRI
jgi:hypothetical protein